MRDEEKSRLLHGFLWFKLIGCTFPNGISQGSNLLLTLCAFVLLTRLPISAFSYVHFKAFIFFSYCKKSVENKRVQVAVNINREE